MERPSSCPECGSPVKDVMHGFFVCAKDGCDWFQQPDDGTTF